ncbi:MAG: ankyrin repeat domain-containing protein [Bacteroidales bacterium]|nr:ankyrin repeat domain-containing protein [Bacteroidales bacterium]
MKKIAIILSILALIASSCGQATKKQAEVKLFDQGNIYTQIIQAIETGNQNSFDELINKIPNIDSLILVIQDPEYNEFAQYQSLLGYACKYKRCNLAKKLINCGADIEIGEADDWLVYDALSVAVQSEDLCLVKLLLDNGANPNRMNSEEGFTVLSLSCRLNNYDITKLLIEKGAKVDGLGYTTGTDYVHYPLLYAVESNNIKLVQLLINNNCKIGIRDRQDETPFTIAERNENQQMTDLLLEMLRKNYKYRVDESWFGNYSYETPYPDNDNGIPFVAPAYSLDITPDSCVFSGFGHMLYFIEKCTVEETATDTLTVRFYNLIEGNSSHYAEPYVVKLFRKGGKYYFNSPVIYGDEENNIDLEVTKASL